MSGHSPRRGWTGTSTRSTTRTSVWTSTTWSTTCTGDRPEAAARRCSQARWRQVSEHHFGTRPVLRSVISAPHQPHATVCPGVRRCFFELVTGPHLPSISTGASFRDNGLSAPTPSPECMRCVALDFGCRGEGGSGPRKGRFSRRLRVDGSVAQGDGGRVGWLDLMVRSRLAKAGVPPKRQRRPQHSARASCPQRPRNVTHGTCKGESPDLEDRRQGGLA